MWFFNSPEIVYGDDALSYLDELPGRRAFIVTDVVLHKLGFTDLIAEHLRIAGMDIGVFPEVEPDPSLETVARGAAAMSEFAPDWIVGLGGGSAMDAAKAMWVLYERPDIKPEEIEGIALLGRTGLGAKARLVAIPTTAGTGAEATWQFVLADKVAGRKASTGTRENMPTLAIVDPALTAGLPPSITADTGIDVLTHAVEGYISAWHNDFTDGPCLKAIELVFAYLPRAVADGSDVEARTKMAIAATLGGLAWGNSWVGVAHAMGHAFNAVFHYPHGRCVGTFLPYTTEFSARGGGTRYRDIAALLQLPATDEVSAGEALAEATRELLIRIGQPTTVAEMGIAEAEHEAALERLCDLGENDLAMPPAVRVPSHEEMLALYRYAYAGRRVDF
jgi:alcohol dehydrogenase class IV